MEKTFSAGGGPDHQDGQTDLSLVFKWLV